VDLAPTLSPSDSLLHMDEGDGPRRVKNANPKSRLRAVALHGATRQLTPSSLVPINNHTCMSNGKKKKRKYNKKIYAGMEFENVCPGIMQRALARNQLAWSVVCRQEVNSIKTTLKQHEIDTTSTLTLSPFYLSISIPLFFSFCVCGKNAAIGV